MNSIKDNSENRHLLTFNFQFVNPPVAIYRHKSQSYDTQLNVLNGFFFLYEIYQKSINDLKHSI